MQFFIEWRRPGKRPSTAVLTFWDQAQANRVCSAQGKKLGWELWHCLPLALAKEKGFASKQSTNGKG